MTAEPRKADLKVRLYDGLLTMKADLTAKADLKVRLYDRQETHHPRHATPPSVTLRYVEADL